MRQIADLKSWQCRVGPLGRLTLLVTSLTKFRPSLVEAMPTSKLLQENEFRHRMNPMTGGLAGERGGDELSSSHGSNFLEM